jgi:hypothetical protein
MNKEDWIVDSGASHHMCCDLKFFGAFQPATTKTFVILADNSNSIIKGTGTVLLSTPIGQDTNMVELKDVLFVPTLNKDLKAVSKIMRNGFQMISQHKELAIYNHKQDNKEVIVKLE